MSHGIGGDYTLVVDPTLSSLTIGVTGVGQDTVALEGDGVAASGVGAAFLFGLVDATGPGTLGVDLYDDWRFWFDQDIDLNVQTGAFVIPAGQAYAFHGRERRQWLRPRASARS